MQLDDRRSYVYEYRDDSGTPYYVGKGTGRRAWQHINEAKKARPTRGTNPHLRSKIQKYLRDGISVEPIIVFRGSHENCFTEEFRLIELYGLICEGTGTLVNLHPGGKGGTYTTTHRESLSKARMGWVMPDYHKEIISRTHKGKQHRLGKVLSEHTKKAISDALTGKTYKKRGPNSSEKNKAIAAALRGQKRSEEAKENMRLAWIRRKEKSTNL